MLARKLSDALRKELNQPVVVDNRSGAGGSIGVGSVAMAPPDGYTIVLGGIGSVVFTEGMFDLNYKPQTDLRPVAMVGSAQSAIVVKSSLNINTLQQLVARAKQEPPLTYGTPGVGSALHLVGAMFEKQAGIKLTHVPYKGQAPALTDLQAGNIDLVFANIAALVPILQTGKAKALAVIDDRPSPLLPGVPTTAQGGVPGVVMTTWYGVMAPAKTSDDKIQKLQAAIAAALKDKEFVHTLQEQGFDPARDPSTAAFAKVLQQDFKQWVPLIKTLGIKGTS